MDSARANGGDEAATLWKWEAVLFLMIKKASWPTAEIFVGKVYYIYLWQVDEVSCSPYFGILAIG